MASKITEQTPTGIFLIADGVTGKLEVREGAGEQED